MSLGGGITINNYLEGKMIGRTIGRSFFVTETKPGSLNVMAHAEN
jgi:hypothetical protein